MFYTCHIINMANNNSFIHNTGLTDENALVHLLYALISQQERRADLIKLSRITQITT